MKWPQGCSRARRTSCQCQVSLCTHIHFGLCSGRNLCGARGVAKYTRRVTNSVLPQWHLWDLHRMQVDFCCLNLFNLSKCNQMRTFGLSYGWFCWFWKWPQGSFSCSRAPWSGLAGRCPCSARTAGAPCWSLFKGSRPGKMPKNHKGTLVVLTPHFWYVFCWVININKVNHAELANMNDWVSNFWDRIIWSEEYPEYPQYCPTSHKALRCSKCLRMWMLQMSMVLPGLIWLNSRCRFRTWITWSQPSWQFSLRSHHWCWQLSSCHGHKSIPKWWTACWLKACLRF